MGMRTKELNGDEYFLELKKHYEYMNGIIQELHVELDELAEKILKTETKRKSIFDAESDLFESKLTYSEYVQSKKYIYRIKDYIDTVKDALNSYQKLQDNLSFYIKNPAEKKNITPNIAEDYDNVTEKVRNYPYIGSRLHRLLSKSDARVSQLVIDAKGDTLAFHGSLAKVRYTANDISYMVGYLHYNNQLDESLNTSNSENDELKIVDECRQEMDMSSDKLIQDNTKEGEVISNKNKIKSEWHIDGSNLTDNIAGLYSREQILSNVVSHDNIIESILLPIPIY
ncbi:hypothetical protein [Providencia sp. PROV178]|uniref:hypothetical protein n=1 Tax=Providencia sp. PROV178 TaxID=2949881 RepID=UPI00234A72A7|nr:hypothetical protein [Providencia sp. PROV178]